MIIVSLSIKSLTPKRGRPRKFTEPSRPVTLTLPEHIIKALNAIDHDLSRAVVRLMQPQLVEQPHPPAELVLFGARAVIVVNPTRTLEQRTGVMLVPLSDGRALIAFDDSLTANSLELVIQDVLEEKDLPDEDARIFEGIRTLLRDARRSETVSVMLRNIMVLEFVGRRAAREKPGDAL